MTATIPRHLRAWDNSDSYRRQAQQEAEGWRPEDEDDTREPGLYVPECPCGSGLAVEDDGGCIACWFQRTERAA